MAHKVLVPIKVISTSQKLFMHFEVIENEIHSGFPFNFSPHNHFFLRYQCLFDHEFANNASIFFALRMHNRWKVLEQIRTRQRIKTLCSHWKWFTRKRPFKFDFNVAENENAITSISIFPARSYSNMPLHASTSIVVMMWRL